jgi:hypothetical protein
MTTFKSRMAIMPKKYEVIQLNRLDSDTRRALLNKVYDNFKTFTKDDYDLLIELTSNIWEIVVERPLDEFDKFLTEVSRSYYDKQTMVKKIIDNFYDHGLKKYFINDNCSIWDQLEICELIVKFPSSKIYNQYHPSEIELKAPILRDLTPKEKEDRENNSHSIFITRPGTREYEEKMQEYKTTSRIMAMENSIQKEGEIFNAIFEIYWIGYRFNKKGELLPCHTQAEQDIIENVIKVAEKKWMGFFFRTL